MALLDICSNYAHDHDIIFNPSKTTCIHFPYHQSSFPSTAIKCVSDITFRGISIRNNDVTDHTISKNSRKFYHKANQVMNDFNIFIVILNPNYCLAIVLMHMAPYYGLFTISL